MFSDRHAVGERSNGTTAREGPASRPDRSGGGAAARRTHVEACRGREGGCPNALIGTAELASRIEAVLAALPDDALRTLLPEIARQPHRRLRVAIAACPNACTQPQIRDIGLIASCRPRRVLPDCTGCGRCAAVCREDAIHMRSGRAELHLANCVGCGQCGRVCAFEALEMGPTQLRLLAGGRLGRHPRLAQELPETVPLSEAGSAVAALLDQLLRHAADGESLSAIAERIGATRLGELLRRGDAGSNARA